MPLGCLEVHHPDDLGSEGVHLLANELPGALRAERADAERVRRRGDDVERLRPDGARAAEQEEGLHGRF